MKNVVYLCDRKQKCGNSNSCGDLCFHTFDPDHALNGSTMNPQTDARFEKNGLYYVEKRTEDEHAT